MAVRIQVDARQYAVKSVTVFQHRAEVKREFRLTLKAGQNEISIDHLPSCLDESSLRVDGYGNATILDVAYQPTSQLQASGKSDALRKMESERTVLVREEKILRTQSKVLDDYTKTLTAKDVNTSQLVEFLGIHRTHGGRTLESLDSLQERLVQLDGEIGAERRRISSAAGPAANSRVTVIISTERDGPIELCITYIVCNATWTPLYDLRAFVDTNTKGNSNVRLHYKASIHQTTGEDWINASIVLSTSSPLVGASVPQLYPWHIGSEDTAKGLTWRGSYKSGTAPAGRIERGSVEQQRSGERSGGRSPSEDWLLPMMHNSSSSAKDGAISTSFHIDGRTSIPSDSSTHKVTIAAIDLASELEWITVPKETPCAFLQCQIRNTSPYVFLQGPANIFLDNNFVSKSSIPDVSPQEQFSCSLGVDPSIRITYHPVIKKSRSGGYILSTKSDTTTYTQRVTIKNTRRTAVSKLIVRDQVPISEDAKFRVNLLEPKDLASAKAATLVEVAQGIYASWVRRDAENMDLRRTSSTSLGMEDADGQIDWICKLAEGSTKEIILAWEIVSPQGERWFRQ